MFEKSKPLILEIQHEALNEGASVTSLLRKVKAAAIKLDQRDTAGWVQHELQGYSNISAMDIPEYRQLYGTLKGVNPYRGYIPIYSDGGDNEIDRLLTFAPIMQAIGTIEDEVRKSSGQLLQYSLGAERIDFLQRQLDVPMEVRLLLGRSQLQGILDAVQNLVLDWSLELEKSGVLGEGMSFSRDEKEKATHVTQQVFAQSIGTLGDVAGHAQVTNNQVSVGQTIDKRALNSLLQQADGILEQLPPDVRDEIKPLLSEISQDTSDDGKTRSRLSSIKAICEGASGNLVAQGIVSAIAALL